VDGGPCRTIRFAESPACCPSASTVNHLVCMGRGRQERQPPSGGFQPLAVGPAIGMLRRGACYRARPLGLPFIRQRRTSRRSPAGTRQRIPIEPFMVSSLNRKNRCRGRNWVSGMSNRVLVPVSGPSPERRGRSGGIPQRVLRPSLNRVLSSGCPSGVIVTSE